MSKLSSHKNWEKAENILALFVLLPLLFFVGSMLGFLLSHLL